MRIREARRGDLEEIVALLADDEIGRTREEVADALPSAYAEAFDEIAADPRNRVLVAEVDGAVGAVLQLTLTRYLTYRGGRRGQIEGVRVAPHARGRGIGRRLVEQAVAEAEAEGCHLVQLTTDKRRTEARTFYESLGFVASHEGMKRHLPRS